MNKTIKIGICILFTIIFISIAYAVPLINLIQPSANTTTTNTSVIINISMTEASLNEFKFNWNSTNYTFYNDSLILMMNFDNVSALGENSSSNKTADVSKYGNNGNCTGMGIGCNWANGKYSGGMKFDGVNDYVQIGTSKMANGWSEISISAWVYFDSLKDYSGVVYSQDLGDKFQAGIELDAVAWYRLYFFVGTGASAVVANSNQGGINTGKWYYAVGTWKSSDYGGDGKSRIYIDGALQGTSANAIGGTVYQNDYFKVGLDDWGGLTRVLNGTVDEVRIWNRSLSADEVSQMYRSNLNKYDTDKWLFYTNQSNLTKGSVYTYLAYAKDSSGNQSQTEKIYLTIQSGTVPTVNTNVFSTSYGSTDFNNVANLNNVTNMVLATQYGKVKWTNGVNVSSQDIDKSVKIGDGFVSINVSALHNTFNTSAKVNISVLSCDEWTIYYSNQTVNSLTELKISGQQVGNGSGATGSCTSQCSNPTCLNNIISFDIAHFDSFGGEGEQGGEVPVPEFSTWAILLALTITTIGFFMIKNKT